MNKIKTIKTMKNTQSLSNNKKGQAVIEFLLTYSWAILVVFVVIGALAYYGVPLSKETFDPGMHKCEYSFQDCFNDIGTDEKLKLCNKFIDNHNDWKYSDDECLIWRPKTSCEINPKGENCVCEETAIKDVTNYSTGQYYCKIFPLKENATLEEELDYVNCVIKEEICTKARDKTPCEKGEEGWIEATLKNCKDDGICIETVDKYCRLKTPQDYGCEDINYALWKDDNFDKDRGVFVHNREKMMLFEKLGKNLITHSGLVELAKERGCLK